jgi:aminopeptidase N
MRKLLCRHCSLSFKGLRQPFALSGALPHYAPDLPFRVEHILLDVTVDPQAKTLEGTVTQKLKTVAANQTRIKLDQVGLTIHEVKVNQKASDFQVEGHSLLIPLPTTPAPGDGVELQIKYALSNPRRGIYFTAPDADYPKKRYQVWTQGQDEDSRYWFPSFDYPNQKATSEVIARVPKGYTAVSNGALLGKKDVGDKTEFHYKIGTPHVTYLITLVVAEFTEWADAGPRGLPVQYFVEPGREADGKRAFSNTPKMIEVYEKKTGIPYPYEKYSQVAVQDFIFGGMENTSATTQTDLTLHDERAHLDFSSDGLVSHELAHQWFGDLLTCRDWSHGWLNEGFATFMERVWIENDTGPNGGLEEAKYYSDMDLHDYLKDDSGAYRRPIVCNTYIEPIDLFDTHLYQKGGLVLNLIRSVLGEESFWKSIRHYVTKHREQNVETIDLIRAIEETTGRNLRRLFDEWVFSAGYPEFELSYTWNDEKKTAELVVEQKQTEGKPSVTKDGATTPLFHLPATVEFTLEGGKKISHVLEIGEARERAFFQLPSKPLMVRFDPGSSIPKTLKFPRPKELLLYQLGNDTDCMGRIEAAHELVKIADTEIIRALGETALKDPFWGVQAKASEALSEIRTDQSRDALITALASPLPKGRRAIVNALGSFKDAKSATALRKIAEKDPSYLVEADATNAWTRASLGGYLEPQDPKVAEVEKFLLKQLEKPSYREIIRATTLRSLALLPGIGTGERPKALSTLIDWSKRGHEMDARLGAIDALGKVAKTARSPERSRIFATLGELADEDNFRIRMVLVGALGATESRHAIGILGKIHEIEIDGRVKRHAQVISDALTTAGTTPESVRTLKEALDKIGEEQKKIRSMLEEQREAKR